jgi:hypothetical protein
MRLDLLHEQRRGVHISGLGSLPPFERPETANLRTTGGRTFPVWKMSTQ